MLIDIHAHCHKTRHPKVRRQEGSQYPTPEQLIEMMDTHGIDMAVLLCTVSPECRNTLVLPEETLEICALYPDRLIPFCNFDSRNLRNGTDADFRPLFEAYRELGCKGIGEFFPNIPFDDPLNMNFFAQVEETGWPLCFHVAPKVGGFYGLADELGLPRFENVLKAFPGVTFLGHSQPFWGEISGDLREEERTRYPEGKVAPGGRVVELMRKYPNLHGDLSAGSGLNAYRRDPEFARQFMEEFQDRLYWGTDVCQYKKDFPMVDYFNQLKEEQAIPEAVWEKIAWRNANRLLDLGIEG